MEKMNDQFYLEDMKVYLCSGCGRSCMTERGFQTHMRNCKLYKLRNQHDTDQSEIDALKQQLLQKDALIAQLHTQLMYVSGELSNAKQHNQYLMDCGTRLQIEYNQLTTQIQEPEAKRMLLKRYRN